MAYNYYPVSYQPMFSPYGQPSPVAPSSPLLQSPPQQVQTPAPAPQVQGNATGGLVWVQGVEGAKAHPVAPNGTVMLMDSEGDRFYLKSSDNSGMPLPLRIFEYKEITQSSAPAPSRMDTSEFVTKAEFDKLRRDVEAITAGKGVTEDV